MDKEIKKTSFFKRFSKKHHLLIGLGILVVMVVHFVIQTAFIQSEKLRSIEPVSKNQVLVLNDLATEEQKIVPAVVEDEPEDVEPQKVRNVEVTKRTQPIVRRLPEKEQTAKTVRKKAVRETKKVSEAERLRRAEEILTGF